MDYPIINFDEASKVWMRNKKKLGNGTYTYVCGEKRIKHNGYCRKAPSSTQLLRKLEKDPSSNIYLAGLKTKSMGNIWDKCPVHKISHYL